MILLLAGGGRAALGHAVLLESSPADGAVLLHAPAQVGLRFNESVQPVLLRVLDSTGGVRALIAAGGPGGTDLQVPLPANLADGLYVVTYRVTSADAHPVAGSFIFHIGSGTTDGDSLAAALLEPGIPWGNLAIVNRTLWIALVMLGGGALLFAGLFRHELTRVGALRAMLSLAFAAVLLGAGLQGAVLANGGSLALLQRDIWTLGLQSTRGTAALVAAAGIALLLLATARFRRRVRSFGLVVGLGLFVASFAISGHAATAQPAAVTRLVLLLHVALVLFWIGSLWPLSLRLRDSGQAAVADLRRFSRLAMPGVALLVGAGAALAVVQVLRPEWLLESRYGLLLLLKLGGVLLLIGLATVNRFILLPRLADGQPRAVLALRRSIAAEMVVGLALLGVTAVLSQTMPPRSQAALISARPEHHVVSFARGRMVDVTVTPARPGLNRVVVAVSGQDGMPLLPREVTAEFALIEKGIEPLIRPLRAEGGQFVLDGVPLTMPGRWTLRIEVLITDFEKALVTVDLPID